jgi:hypothetical protein
MNWKSIKNVVFWAVVGNLTLVQSYAIYRVLEKEIQQTGNNITELSEQAQIHISNSVEEGKRGDLESAYQELSIAVEAYNLIEYEMNQPLVIKIAKNRKIIEEIKLEKARLNSELEILRFNLNHPVSPTIIQVPERTIEEEPKLEKAIIEEEEKLPIKDQPKKQGFFKRLFQKRKNS